MRELIATRIDQTTLGTGHVREAHERFERMQRTVMNGEKAPSERVVHAHRAVSGQDDRLRTEAPTRPASSRAADRG